ncbi:MAG: GntR family transcriptional regulator [Spirochaetales bacterium]|nr:GntR family transcriptional regulator [Spirochaetales bacterium]
MNRSIVDQTMEFRLDTASGLPVYRQIIQQIEHAILSGRLAPGDRLPTIRALSVELKVNPNTIQKAYAELELRGIVSTQVGSGTFVADAPIDSAEDELLSRIEERVGRFVKDMEELGIGRERMVDLVRDFREDR